MRERVSSLTIDRLRRARGSWHFRLEEEKNTNIKNPADDDCCSVFVSTEQGRAVHWDQV